MVKATTIKKAKSGFNDEFESYLKKQCVKTTFNGSELESFSWYKKVLGLVQFNYDVSLQSINARQLADIGYYLNFSRSVLISIEVLCGDFEFVIKSETKI